MAWTLGREFPTDLWAEHGFAPDFDVKGTAQALLPVLDIRFGASRDIRMVERFCREYLPAGRIFIYGAGTHTTALLPVLRDMPRITILGIVDRLAASVEQFDGIEVILPQALARRDFDYVLLSHGQYETEMIERLSELGISADKIVPLYVSEGFRRFSRTASIEQIRQFGARRIRNVIINCTRDYVVADDELRTMFALDETICLFMGRPDCWQPDGLYPAIDLHESLDALCAAIRLLRPQTVYVRSIVYKNFLSMVVKERFPGICVIHEMYDYAAVWREEDLIDLFGMNSRTISETRMSELYSGHHLDAIVSKRGGPYWASVQDRCPAPYELYFPLIAGDVTTVPSPSEGVLRLVYCGFLPAAAFLAQFKNGYNFLDLMQALSAQGGYEIDLFNAAHVDREHDGTFQNYLTRFRTGGVHYNRRVPHNELVGRMKNYDFGWLCEVVNFFQPDRYFGIGNRWTCNIMGGLPTIIDDSWKLMGALTTEYHAGVVVSEVTVDGIVAAIDQVRGRDLRSGVQRLRRHLKASNEGALSRIAERVERHRCGADQ